MLVALLVTRRRLRHTAPTAHRGRANDCGVFVTRETTLALNTASHKNPAGKVELGFTVADVDAFYREMSAKGVLFRMPPKKQDFGGVLAQFVDSEGAHCSVGTEAA
jgi:uncharacterized glyoxalase superfamily protein PhnB